MKITRIFIGCVLLGATRAYAAPATAPTYSRAARDRVVATMLATEKQLKPIPRIDERRDFLVGLAQLGEDTAAWNAARQLKLDKRQAGYDYGSAMHVTIEHVAALHWIAAGDITRALKIAESFSAPELVAREDDLQLEGTLKQSQADIWLNAANRLVRLGKREEARRVLMQAAPVVRVPNHFGARGYFAWLLAQVGDTQDSIREFAETRRNFDLYSRTAAKSEFPQSGERDDRDGGAWLAVWHLRAGLDIEAAEIARRSEAYQIPSYLDGKIQHVNLGGDPHTVENDATAPFARRLLARAQTALKQGKRAEARRFLQGADTFASMVAPAFEDASGKSVCAQLLLRNAALYDALGDVKEAQSLRKEINMVFGPYGTYAADMAHIEKLQPEQQWRLWVEVLQHSEAWSRRHPALVQRAVQNALSWTRKFAAIKDPNSIYPSLALTRALFMHGYDAQARETARVALHRAIKGDIWINEITETMFTAKVLSDHSAVGSPDHALVQAFLSWVRRNATNPRNDLADALILAASGWLDEAVVTLKAKPGDEARVASIWAQKRGALATLAWVNQIKDASSRAEALAAVAAVIAEQRDKQLPEPLYRWIDDRITEIQRIG